MILSGATFPGLAADWLRVESGLIAEIGTGPSPGGALDLGAGWLVPGFVDMHVHGGGGASFQAGQADDVARFHRAHGTTSLVASLVSAPVDDLVNTVQDLASSDACVGIHLEGPFIAEKSCGAHDRSVLLDPTRDDLRRLLDAGPVRMATIAPERAGALDAIRLLNERGLIAAVGHTSGSYEEVRLGIAAGASVATHLFNAMPPLHHRAPGPLLALLEEPGVVLEVIADGVHVHPDLIRWVFAIAPGRVALITDAMSAAGLPDGKYQLGSVDVTVDSGVPRLTSSGDLAGSTLTMDAAIRTVVAAGVPLIEAVNAATATPARALGLTDRGRLAVGLRADLVHLSPQLEVRSVWVAGEKD